MPALLVQTGVCMERVAERHLGRAFCRKDLEALRCFVSRTVGGNALRGSIPAQLSALTKLSYLYAEPFALDPA